MLEFSHVTKRYGGLLRGAMPGARKGRAALDDVSFEVERGEIFGLLGHNGAGKSTAVGIMLGMVIADAGEVKIDGISVRRDREKALQKVGAIFESPSFYEYLTGWQNLKALTEYSLYWDEGEARKTVEMVGLADRIHSNVSTYSHGMRQRLALAQALLPRPELLLLDEPTEGLDPDGVIDLRHRIRYLAGELGVTMLLNSHLLSEVEQVCGRVGILREGKMVYTGAIKELGLEGRVYRVEVDDRAKAEQIYERLGVRRMEEGKIAIPEGKDVAELIEAMVTGGVKLREVAIEAPSLEDLYLRESRGGAENTTQFGEK